MNMTTLNNTAKVSNIDFHSHILPGIDDGAKTVKNSIELIKTEIKHGIDTIVLTPHFYPETDEYETFLQNRQAAYNLLLQEAEKEKLPVNFILGAEVKFSPKILDMNLQPLCIQNTDYIMLEFSLTHYPSWTKDVFYKLQAKGFLPIIAHAERYSNMPNDELYDLVNAGAIIQVNTGSLTKDKTTAKKVEKLINANLVHIWGTDTHSVEKRPPTFASCKEFLDKKYSEKYLNKCMQYSRDILNNNIPNVWEPSKIKKGLFW